MTQEEEEEEEGVGKTRDGRRAYEEKFKMDAVRKCEAVSGC